MSSPQYDNLQIIASLCSVANAASYLRGSQEKLTEHATKVIKAVLGDGEAQELIGNWELAFGPNIFQAKNSDVADNAYYVARNIDDPTKIVVAVAGTNPLSMYGWIHEDFALEPMQEWSYGSCANESPKITMGTKTGMDIILSLKDDKVKDIVSFLTEEVASNNAALNITFTGHSMGGVLSPPLALAFNDQQGLEGNWDPAGKSIIKVQTTAGLSPGDKIWAEYFDTRLGAATKRLGNSLDMVPYDWNIETMSELPSLYEPHIEGTYFIGKFVELGQEMSKSAGDLFQIKATENSLPGTFDPDRSFTIKHTLMALESLLGIKLIEKLGEELGLKVDQIATLILLAEALQKFLEGSNPEDRLLPDALHSKLMELQGLPSFLEDVKTHIEKEIPGFLKDNLPKPLGEEWIKAMGDFVNFFSQAIYQHNTAYEILLNYEAFAAIFTVVKSENPM